MAAESAVVSPIDWTKARAIAARTSRGDHLANSYLAESLPRDFDEVTLQAWQAVSDFTGWRTSSVPRAVVVTRTQWVDANLRLLQELAAPLLEKVGKRLSGPRKSFARRFGALEVGILLGFMSQRVLGQFGLRPREPNDTEVYFVGANVLALEKRHGLRPRDFRMWIALHEVTHFVQFHGVKWLRPHFLSLVGKVESLAAPDPERLQRAVKALTRSLRSGDESEEDLGFVSLMVKPEQRELLYEIQALMSIVEGHAEYVMNNLGSELVTGHGQMRRTISARRANSSGFDSWVRKLFGLDAKLRQYGQGERFIDSIVQASGDEGLKLLWKAPENLPTLNEVTNPAQWITRMDLSTRDET